MNDAEFSDKRNTRVLCFLKLVCVLWWCWWGEGGVILNRKCCQNTLKHGYVFVSARGSVNNVSLDSIGCLCLTFRHCLEIQSIFRLHIARVLIQLYVMIVRSV